MIESQLSSAHRLLLFVVVAAIVFVATFLFYSDDIFAKACALVFGLAVVYLTVHVVLPPEERTQRTVRLATWAFLIVATGAQSIPIWVPVAVEYLSLSASSSAALLQATDKGYVITLAALVAYACLLVFGVDRSALGKIPSRITKEFTDLNFTQRLNIFCDELLSELNLVERDLRWNVSHFVSIDAEVEIVSDTGRTRRVMDLFTALKRARSSGLVLVLGVPGSGKSVALRKLCRELMADVAKSGRIPVYVNLKEWADAEPWTLDRKPTESDLRTFVYRNVRDRLSDQTKPFFDTYFDRLVATGRIFFRPRFL